MEISKFLEENDSVGFGELQNGKWVSKRYLLLAQFNDLYPNPTHIKENPKGECWRVNISEREDHILS